MPNSKRAKITDEHLVEAAKLKTLWDDGRPHKTQAVFGEHYELGNQANVGHYLNGRSPLNLKAASAFAQELACDIAEFSPRLAAELTRLRGSASAPQATETPPKYAAAPTVVKALEDEFVAVRRADVRFANGTGQLYYEADDKPPLVFRMDFLRRLGIKAGRAVVVDSRGISNEPKIRDRSVVLVNEGDREHLDGDFFAFRYDGELLIKRLERVEGVGILATAENSNFRPKQKLYTDLADFEVIGRCVWEGAEL